MIDSHAHLYWPDYDKDFDEVIKRSVETGLTHIINIGVDLDSSKKALNQAQKVVSLKVYSTIGLHPTDTSNTRLSTIDDLEALYRKSPERIIGVGECGLDYYHVSKDHERKRQRLLFRAQIELAKKLNLPLIIHCRDAHSTSSGPSAWDEIFEFLDNTLTGVFHCWSGSYQDAQKALSLGFYISFAGNITYPNANNLRQVASLIPLNRILIETDSPFLSPQDKRGQRNDPTSILQIAQTIAQIKNLNLLDVAKATTQNTKNLFKI